MKKGIIIGVATAIVAVVAILLVITLNSNRVRNHAEEPQSEVPVVEVSPEVIVGSDEKDHTTPTVQTPEVAETSPEKEEPKDEPQAVEDAKEPSVTTEVSVPEEEPEEPAQMPAKESGTPVANHGELKVSGTDLVDASGKKFQIRGVSTHGIAWFPQYVNKDAFRTMRDEWGINCVRLAMYSGENSGYCTGGNQTELKNLVNSGVSYCTDLGLYAIIDWHVLGDQNPQTYQTQAIAFFDEMSKKYANYDNVLYEICNEPNGGTTWSQVKSYAEAVIPVIKKNNPDAIIIVGTPTWSQDVDQAAANPIKGYSNIMYTVHFYADTHKDWLRQRMVNAKKAGIPIFCTEFSICDASGNGALNVPEGNAWIKTMNDYNISYCIWSLCNKAESASLISSGCNKTSGWTAAELSEVGKWYVGILGNNVDLGSTAVPEPQDGGNNGNNGNGNGGNGNNGTPAVTADSANTSVSIAATGGWDTEGGYKCTQYTVTIKNTGSAPIRDWKISVNFSGSITLDQSWSGNFTASGSKVSFTPVDYNREIAAGGSCEVGFIVKYKGNLGTPSITIE